MRVVIEGISKRYRGRRGEVEALRTVDFESRDGEFVAVLGPSGCGKSTLLSIVAGLIPPTSGRVRFVREAGAGQEAGAGRDVAEARTPPAAGPEPGGAAPRRPLTAVVFQEFALFPWRTVRQNVAFGPEVRGLPASERRERVERYLAMVGLTPFADKYPGELSGGMKQRVGIARALANDPEVLLMDEPLSALDAQTRSLMQLDLLRLWRETAKTVLYVTHNLQEAAFLSERILLLSRRPGRVRAVIDVPFARPRDEDLLATPEFAAFSQDLWSLLRDEARAAMEAGEDG
ncbi:ABC transporter ATP-binding protein [Limnochorda pilosa]|uniref:ABC transporter ATP-binding protein n=1 Tax=Limnochorda pilosa TaxID=1555112 RepID=A0A0K2SK54_LIMPI|nr:ABC transporter ATP-binding protein [Limnochorda pilosa]BAS27209.1 ABC transporter ATP-binding protein [Limnochorda pilosa]